MKKILAILLSALSMASAANAGMSVNLLGGMNFSNDKLDPAGVGVTTSPVGGITYGATLEFSVAPMINLEFGAIQTSNKSKSTIALGYQVTENKSLVIPLLVRFTALPIIDFGVGGYYATVPKTYKITETTIPGGTTGENDVTDASSNDYGLRARVRAKIPLAPMFGFLIDLNYTLVL